MKTGPTKTIFIEQKHFICPVKKYRHRFQASGSLDMKTIGEGNIHNEDAKSRGI